MTPMKKISEWWTEYAERVIPKGAPRVQYIESRRAFYQGARALFDSLMGALEPGTEPTENDLAKMDNLKEELDQFTRDLREGRA